jgi:hypothetical protein
MTNKLLNPASPNARFGCERNSSTTLAAGFIRLYCGKFKVFTPSFLSGRFFSQMQQYRETLLVNAESENLIACGRSVRPEDRKLTAPGSALKFLRQ